MQLQEFIGKTVIRTWDKKRLRLCGVTAPKILAQTLTPDAGGHHTCYGWSTVNGDPFSKGALEFEDPGLLAPFLKAYAAYCRTPGAYWEEYDYWMRRD